MSCYSNTIALGRLVSSVYQRVSVDTTNPRNMPDSIGTLDGWSLGDGVTGNGILRLYPRRAALAFNLALARFTKGAMESGNDY